MLGANFMGLLVNPALENLWKVRHSTHDLVVSPYNLIKRRKHPSLIRIKCRIGLNV